MQPPIQRYPPLPPDDAPSARAAVRLLARHAHGQRALTVRVREGEQEHPIELPAGALAPLLDVLEALAGGRGLAIVPDDAEVTTAEAAEVLGVSRPFLVKLLERGDIPHRKVGTHRRVRTADLLAYKARDDRAREAVLDELVRDAQEQDMGYRRP